MGQSNRAIVQNGMHYRTCNLCEAMCGLKIEMQDGEIQSIKGDEKDPLSRGHICPKAVALQDLHNDPDRLKLPIKKMPDGSWMTISWGDAIRETAEKLATVSKQHGRNSIASYLGNPNVHNYGNLLFGPAFLKTLGSKNKYSATSVDQLPHHMASYFMFGHQLFIPVPDIDRTDFFIVWGGNPMASNGSLMTVPDIKKRIAAIRARGGKVIVVDPRYTETSSQADQHIFIKPGSDVLLMLALLNIFTQKSLPELPSYIADANQQLEKLKSVSKDYTPENISEATGVSAEVIYQLADEWLKAESAVCYGRLGVSVQKYGGLCQWLVNVLNIITGNFDRSGGVMFTDPAVDLVGVLGKQGSRGHYDLWQSRVRGLPEFSGEFPVSVLAEEISESGEGQVKVLVTMAGNPVLSTPNGKQLADSFSSLEFMVSIDYYLNETTQYADIILPPTAPLEKDHYDLIFHTMAVRNTAKYSEALFEGEDDSKADWQILLRLTEALEKAQGRSTFKSRMVYKLLGWLEPKGLLNLMLKYKVMGGGKKLSLKQLKANPEGIDLGELTPCMPQRLFHKDKLLQLTPDVFVNELDRVRQELLDLTQQDNNQLLLIGRRHLRSNNSWLHNSLRLVKGKDRCTLLMNPKDAERRGISDRQILEISSRVGIVKASVELTDSMMEGVVSLPHGWGHTSKNTKMAVAEAHAGVSMNDLTDEMQVDELTGNAVLNAVPVTVRVAEKVLDTSEQEELAEAK